MGGIVIIIASLIGYVLGHVLTGDPMTASGVLVLFLMTGLGLVGFIDDFIKLFMRRGRGLRSGDKLLGACGGCSPACSSCWGHGSSTGAGLRAFSDGEAPFAGRRPWPGRLAHVT